MSQKISTRRHQQKCSDSATLTAIMEIASLRRFFKSSVGIAAAGAAIIV